VTAPLVPLPNDAAGWGVFDSWQSRWCPLPDLSYAAALHRSRLYNLEDGEASAYRYRAQRKPETE
jgi:hypothetical protein